MAQNPDPLAGILTQAERDRRRDRAYRESTGTLAGAAGEGTAAGGLGVTLDGSGHIPVGLLPPGLGGGGGTFRFEQDTPSDTWTVVHNLNGHPDVRIEDAEGPIGGAVDYPDDNTVVISFTTPIAGFAHLTL